MQGVIGSASFVVSDSYVQVLYLDVELVASAAVTTTPTTVRSVSRQSALLSLPRFVTFRQSRIDVSVSALFSDGTRSQLSLQPGLSTSVSVVAFNDSIVTSRTDAIDGFPHLRAVGQADGDIVEVTWQSCGGLAVTGLGRFNISLNQHPPVFAEDARVVSINESVAVGSQFITVVAIDNDATTIHSSIEYEILSGNEEGFFAIDTISGVVTLRRSLDFEQRRQFVIVVQATDSEQRQSLGGSGSGMDISTPARQTVSSFPGDKVCWWSLRGLAIILLKQVKAYFDD